MDVKNNPAGRLHELLTAAKAQEPNQTVRKAWAAVFGVESTDTGMLLKMLADLIDLVDETKKAIQRLKGVEHSIYLKPFAKIETALSHINLEAGWEHWKQQLDETTLYGLQFSADQLSRISGFTHIKTDDLGQLRKDVEELVAKILETELPVELKALFLRNLEAIRHALLAYRVRGLEGLEQEIERSVGSLVLHKKDIEKTSPKSAERGALQAFFELIKRLHYLVAFARNSKELAGPALEAIEHMVK